MYEKVEKGLVPNVLRGVSGYVKRGQNKLDVRRFDKNKNYLRDKCRVTRLVGVMKYEGRCSFY